MPQELVETVSHHESHVAASSLVEQLAAGRLRALKQQKFPPEGKPERVAKALAVLQQPSAITLSKEEWKLIAEDPDLEDQF